MGSYLHNNGSYAAMVILSNAAIASPSHQEAVRKLGDQLAQHIVAMDPDGDLQPRTPEAAVKALLAQPYVFNSARSVGDVVAGENKALGQAVQIVDYVRWGCGGKK